MSKIEWTGETWNCVIGCTHASEGCRHCYAEGQVHRFGGRYDRPTTIKLGRKADALTRLPVDSDGKSLGKGAQWTGAVWLLPDVLELPLRRKKPTTYFVNSLADWAHESIVESEQARRFLAAMFGVMAATPQHTYQLLTKRPEQARKWFEWLGTAARSEAHGPGEWCRKLARAFFRYDDRVRENPLQPWPLPNVWLGASVEDQATADERIPALFELPAAVRFLSAEPLLGPIGFAFHWLNGDPETWPLDWIITGGESGPKARPCDVAWIRSVVEQCKAAGVPVFCKQLGARPVVEQRDCPACDGAAVDPTAMTEHDDACDYAGHDILDNGGGRCTTCGVTLPPCSTCGPYHGRTPPSLHLLDVKGGDMSEWPEDLRVREMPA